MIYDKVFTEQYRLLTELNKYIEFLGVKNLILENNITKDPINLGLTNLQISNNLFTSLCNIFKITESTKKKAQDRFLKNENIKGNVFYKLLQEQYRQLKTIDLLLDEMEFQDYLIEFLEDFTTENQSIKLAEKNFYLTHKIIQRIKV
jgi:hypothetical protein